MGKIKVMSGSGGGSSTTLDLIETGTHYMTRPTSETIKSYVGTVDVTNLSTYTPAQFPSSGSQVVNVDFGGVLQNKVTVNVQQIPNYFSYTGSYQLLSDNKVLVLTTSGTLTWNSLPLNTYIIGGGKNGGTYDPESVSNYLGGGNGGQVIYLSDVTSGTYEIVIGGIGANTTAFGQTATGGGGAAGGTPKTSSSTATMGAEGTTITFGSYSIAVAGGGSGGMQKSGYTRIAGNNSGGGYGGGQQPYSSSYISGGRGTTYGAGGGGGCSAGTAYYSGGSGKSGAIYLYNGSPFILQS